MDIEVQSEFIGEILKFTLKGKLLTCDAKEFSDTLQNQLQDHQKLLFDLSGLNEIDYDGLRALLSSLQCAVLKGCSAKLAAIQPVPRILFDITRVSQVFECHPTVQEALEALKAPDDSVNPQ
ncbi:MAG: STAS domain-containing protein [Victivallales bacterium]|nr:STAS domain-containing protein [Victivallales bacterium]